MAGSFRLNAYSIDTVAQNEGSVKGLPRPDPFKEPAVKPETMPLTPPTRFAKTLLDHGKAKVPAQEGEVE